MSTITKEWLQQKITAMEVARDEIPFGLDEDDSNTLAALRIALASLEAENKLSNFVSSQVSLGGEFEKVLVENLHELYVGCDTAPPAPVSVPDEIESTSGSDYDDYYCDGWNACRAAMLQGADGNSPVIPDGYALVPVEPTEDMIVNGFESEPDESFSDEKEWEAYDAMSGCQQAAHRAKLCWAAMIEAAPKLKHDLT